MTIIDIPPRDEIDAQLTHTKELLRAASILIDDLPVDDVGRSQVSGAEAPNSNAS
jgi:hypothetical protein